MKVPTMNQEFLDHNEPTVRVQIELVGSKCRLTIVDHENFEFLTLDFKELELKVYHNGTIMSFLFFSNVFNKQSDLVNF